MTATKHTRARAEIALPEGEELIWMIIQKLDRQGTWTIGDVATFAGTRENITRGYIMRLEAAGYVGAADGRKKTTRKPAQLYQVRKTSAVAPRISKDGVELPETRIQTMWRTMRMLKSFTIPDLAGYIDDPNRPVSVASVRVYVSTLLKAGVLAVDGPVKRGQFQTVRVVKHLGPRAPRILSARIVYDPNAKATLGVAECCEAVQ